MQINVHFGLFQSIISVNKQIFLLGFEVAWEDKNLWKWTDPITDKIY